HNQDKAHGRLEEANGRAHAVACRDETGPVDIGVENVAGCIDSRVVKRQDLFETSLEHISQIQTGQQNNHGENSGDIDMADALPTSRSVDGGCFVQLWINAG